MAESGTLPHQTDDREIDLLGGVRAVWAGKFWVLLFTTLTLCACIFYLTNTPPTYQADALLQLEEKTGRLSLPTGLTDLVEDTSESVTEIEIIRSRMVLGQVVADLNLDWVATPRYAPIAGFGLTRVNLPFLSGMSFMRPFASGEEHIRLDLLQVPPEWIGLGLPLTIMGAKSYELGLPDGKTLKGVIGVMLRDPGNGFALKVGDLQGNVGREFLIVQIRDTAAIAQLRQSTSVIEKGRQSGILQLRYTAANQATAQRVLHAISHAYVRQNVSRSAAEAQSSLEFVVQQLPDAEATVSAAKTELNAYRESQTAIDLSFETQSLLTQIGQLEAELSQLQIEEDTIKENYTPNHPIYKQLLNTKAHLGKRIADLREETARLPETQREVFDKTRKLELAEKTYLELLSRAQELRVLKASSIGNVRIIDEAQASLSPIAPRRSRVLAMGTLLGVILGIAFVVVQNVLTKGIQSSEQIEELGIPVFATINKSTVAETASRRRGKKDILAISSPTDLAVEGFRSLRTSLHFGMLDKNSKSIAITSPAPNAGKSFASVNLATVAAQAGKRVCLIDADLRRGQLRKFFDVRQNKAGLAEFLADEVALDEVLNETGVEGLKFISTGSYPPNPSELLMRPSLRNLIGALDEEFDLIIFDSPPALAVTDPVIISREVGTVLTVIRFDETVAGEVEAMRKAFDVAGLRIAGAILNGFEPKKGRSGQYYSYNYRYSYKRRKE